MIEELYIDHQQVDIPSGGLGIALNLRSNLFADIDKVVGNYTNTIHLPKTGNNMAVFAVPNVSNKAAFPYQYHEARYLRDGVEIIKTGKAVLLSIGADIEISIIWGVLTALIDVKGQKLNELTDSTVRATLAEQPTPTEVGQSPTPTVLWAAYNSGRRTYKPAIPVELPFMPSLSVQTILNKIATQYGLTVTLPAGVDVSGLLVPIITRNGDSSTYGGALVVNLTGVAGGTYPIFVWEQSSSIILNIAQDAGYNVLIKSDVADAAVTISGGFITQYIIAEPSVTIESIRQGLAGLRIGAFVPDGSEMIGYITPEDYTPTVTRIEDYQGYYAYSVTYALKGNFQLPSAGMEIYMNVPQMLHGVPLVYFHPEKVFAGRMIISADVPDATAFGYTIPVFKNLPAIEIVQFIKAICALFDLYPVVVGSEIELHAISELATTQAQDWTNYVMVDETTSFRVENYAQHNRLKWLQDETVSGSYDGDVRILDETLEYEHDLFTMPFAAADEYGIPSWSRNDDNELEYKEPKPKLMRREDDDNFAFARFTGLSFADIVYDRYEALQGILSSAKVVKVQARIPDVVLKDFDPSTPIYIAQFGVYFAVMDIKSRSNGDYELTIIKI